LIDKDLQENQPEKWLKKGRRRLKNIFANLCKLLKINVKFLGAEAGGCRSLWHARRVENTFTVLLAQIAKDS